MNFDNTWLVRVKLDPVRVVFEFTEAGDIKRAAFILKDLGVRLEAQA